MANADLKEGRALFPTSLTRALLLYIWLFLPLSLLAQEETPQELWRYQAGGPVRGVAVDPENGQILCGSTDKHLHCLDRSGALLWKYQTGGDVYGVAFDPQSGLILCGSHDKHLRCLDQSGALLWTYKTGGPVYGVAVDPQSSQIFCSSGDNHLHCLDRSGALLWKYPLPIVCHYQLALDPTQSILFCPSESNLCAISYGPTEAVTTLQRLEAEAHTLQEERASLRNKLLTLKQELDRLYEAEAALQRSDRLHLLYDRLQTILTPLQGQSTNIFVHNQSLAASNLLLAECNTLLQGEVTELERTIEELEEELFHQTREEAGFTLEHYSIEALSLALCPPRFPGDLYLVTPAVDYKGKRSLGQLLQCFDPHFNPKWSKLFGEALFSIENPPVIDDLTGSIYFLSQERELCQLSGQHTFILLDKERYSSPTVGDNGLLYLSSEGGTLYALDPATGEIMWEKKTGQTIYPTPCVNKDGIAYFASETTLYAIDPIGELLLAKNLGIPITSPIRIDPQGNLYFLSADDRLTSVDPDGELLWHYCAPALTLPAFDLNQKIYLGSQHKIVCLDLEGQLLWRKVTKDRSPIRFHPFSNSQGEVYFLTEEGTLHRKRELSFLEKYF